MSPRLTTNYAKLVKEAKQMLASGSRVGDDFQRLYDEGYIAGLKDAKAALKADAIAAKKGKTA